MKLGTFEFIKYVEGMFDRNNPHAIFIFKHVQSNTHFAASYWDSARYEGVKSYPSDLKKLLRREKGDVEVYAMPLLPRSRTYTERKLSAVIDALISKGLYKKPLRDVSGLGPNPYIVTKIEHVSGNMVFYGWHLSNESVEEYYVRMMQYFDQIVKRNNIREETIYLVFKDYVKLLASEWKFSQVAVLDDQTAVYRTIEELSIESLKRSQLVLNRIRTRPSAVAYSLLRRFRPPTVKDFVAAAMTGGISTLVK